MNRKFAKMMMAMAAALVTTVSVAPAHAVIITFATFSPLGTGANVRWANDGGSANTGTGGSLFSIGTPSSTAFNQRSVTFSFLQAGLSPFVTNATALFSLNASAPSGNPAQLFGGILVQDNIFGSFSFTSTSAITIGSTTYAAGSNFLTGTFGSTAIGGARNGTSASFSGSTAAGDTLTYTSDFLSFANVLDSDFSLFLNGVSPALQALPTSTTPNSALRSFSAVAGGNFSTDPAPDVLGVPEPMTWSLMISGFGFVGGAMRIRRVKAIHA